MRVRILVIAAMVVAVGVFLVSVGGAGGRGGAPRFVGTMECARCHAAEHALWIGSDHDLAMEEATEETVLGDFDGATFEHFGVTSTFTKHDGKFFVNTDGPDGELRDFEVRYTFGFYPLQQYLIEFPGGRLQALSLCWDSHPKEQGGQRWYHLYPDEPIPHDDELHWTGPNQNWNYMCAECHSTDLHKNYDVATDRYDTTWSEIDVACEACHGPASLHVEQADGQAEVDPQYGFAAVLGDRDGAAWLLAPDAVTAHRVPPRSAHTEVEACARCHSRRSPLLPDYVHGRPLLDTHRLALLDELLYHPDGQILEEVYVYGSFLQSRMYRAGVTCTDCHEPHRLTMRATGNALCTRCHVATYFDAPSHHFHEPGSAAAACVACHMPVSIYMGVDPRLDHSIRVPRPDLSVRLGTPNACNQCHADQTARWAADAVAGWYGEDRRREPHFGEALAAGRSGQPGASGALRRLADDLEQPGIARATALTLLARYPGPEMLDTISRALDDDDPLVRLGALQGLDGVPPAQRLSPAWNRLDDPIRAVRIDAARALAPVASSIATSDHRRALDRALEEYREAQRATSDRPESHLNLGGLAADLGRPQEAETAFRTALRIDPRSAIAAIDLAELYRRLGRDGEGERVLRDVLRRRPDQPDLLHHLGLVLVRQKRLREAFPALERAAELRPEDPRYAYIYAIALHDTGDPERALGVLHSAHERHPHDRAILQALVDYHGERGEADAAQGFVRKLQDLDRDR